MDADLDTFVTALYVKIDDAVPDASRAAPTTAPASGLLPSSRMPSC